jgi:hypothetical protein
MCAEPALPRRAGSSRSRVLGNLGARSQRRLSEHLDNFFFNGGAPPQALCDVNGDGTLDALDEFYLRNFLESGGAPPV